ncbi:lipid binding protein, partial [Trifolium pratense]
MDAIASELSELNKSGSSRGGSERSSSEDKDRGYFGGWVYHLGVNSLGREYCHLRFLFIRGKYVCMYKRDPHDNPAI